MSEPEFSKTELAEYELYCIALMSKLHFAGREVTDVCRYGLACAQCARKVPSGIPVEHKRTEWYLCPRCVTSREVRGGIERKLDAMVPAGSPAEVIQQLRQIGRVAKPAPARQASGA